MGDDNKYAGDQPDGTDAVAQPDNKYAGGKGN